MTTATIQTSVETMTAFFQALAQFAASDKRGQKALSGKDEMLTARRIVRISLQSGHAFCVARVDMLEYGVKAGELFQLMLSDYSDEQGNAYFYVVADGCSCKSYEHRHSCCHRVQASEHALARYHRLHELAVAKAVAPLVLGEEFAEDLEAHVEASIEEDDFSFEAEAEAILKAERRAQMTPRQRETLEKMAQWIERIKAAREDAPLGPPMRVEQVGEYAIPMR